MIKDLDLINKLIFYPKTIDDLCFKVSSEVILYFEDSTSKSILLILKEVDKESFNSKLQNISKLLNKDFTCKLIGNNTLFNKITLILQEVEVSITNKIIRSDSFDLVYFPKLNKLRISKEVNSFKINNKIRTLIVDDSPTIRNLLQKILESSGLFNIVGKIGDPLEVDEFLSKNSIDLITLDIHMPNLNGVELLKIIFPKYRIPTVMISSIRIEEGPYIMEALEIGAIDYIEKPSLSELGSITPYIIEKLKSASNSKTKIIKKPMPPKIILNNKGYKKDSLLLIGASTGGVEALKYILENLPDKIPPIIIVQHIPKVFSKALANRLDKLCPFIVKEAETNEVVEENKVIIAPGGVHLKLLNHRGKLSLIFDNGIEVNRFKPSIDVLFKSVAKDCPLNTVAALLTGMGRDGAAGLLELRNAGAITIAQDEKSCVVFGMPKEAIALEAVDHILSLDKIPNNLINLVSSKY